MSAFASSFDDCKNKFAPEFSKLLNSSYINYNSTTLGNDVAKILQPSFNNILNNDPDCVAAKNDLLTYRSAMFSIKTSQKIFDINLEFGGTSSMQDSLEFESVMPWYGILVVKKGSLDDYINKDLPVIQTEFMKENKDIFYPGNSDKPLGMWSGCTHSNHTANDNDVINRASHVTADEEDSFWSGNDYYVYDGKDVYWGTAQLIGEVALALLTFGVSAEVSAGKTAAQTAMVVDKLNSVSKAGLIAKETKLVSDAAKIKEAADALKAVKTADKAAAIAKAEAAGVKFSQPASRISLKSLKGIGNSLEATSILKAGIGTGIKTAWKSGFFKPWRLVTKGASAIRPKNIVTNSAQMNKLTGIKRNIATAAIAGGETGLGLALIKAYGYSTSSIELAKNVKFSAFGLLSADDIEGHENDVSHGTWLKIDDLLETYDGDKLDESLAWAEAFKEDVDRFNTDGQCDVDIYVVQVGISNPNSSLGKREAYYWLYTNPERDKLRVNGK